VALTLSQQGAAATSVLDSQRVEAVLARLKPSELKRALEGLELLARASQQTMKAKSLRSS
jgi:hypothetical protein